MKPLRSPTREGGGPRESNPTREPGDRPGAGATRSSPALRWAMRAGCAIAPLASPPRPVSIERFAQRACCARRKSHARSSYLGGAVALLLLPLVAAALADRQLQSGRASASPPPAHRCIADQEVAPVIVIGPSSCSWRGPRTSAAVLRQYAGLDMAGNGGPGQPASLFLRGTNSTHTLVMIDGVRINPDDGFGSALQNIRLTDIERIEIVKGPRASLYGSDAIGGVINIITRKAGQGHCTTARKRALAVTAPTTAVVIRLRPGRQRLRRHPPTTIHTDGFPAVAGTTARQRQHGPHPECLRPHPAWRRGPGLQPLAEQRQHPVHRISPNPPFGLVPFDEDFQNQATSVGPDGQPSCPAGAAA